YALTTFIPLFFISKFMISETSANGNLTLYSLVGVLATLFGGRLADHFGLNKLVKFGFAALVPLIFIFITGNHLNVSIFLIIPISFAMNCTYGSLIAVSQSFVPKSLGLASGISLGLSVSVGGFLAPLIGIVGDHYGLDVAMYIIFGFSVLGFLLTFIMPKEIT
ncbi:MAG: MFS transporter, partial [Lachnospirales bacterium]